MLVNPTLESLVVSIAILAVMLLVAFPIHEFAHALAAYRLGDGTAKLMGRLTLDPRAHFDPMGGLLLVISVLLTPFGFGWAKPTPYNPRMLRGGRWGEAIVSVAGPISNLALAIAGAIPLRYINATNMDAGLLTEFLSFFVIINLVLMVFNLIPIPPLDGSRLLDLILSPKLAHEWQRWGPGMLMLLVLAPYITGGAFSMLTLTGPFVDLLLRVFLGDATTIRFS